MAASALLGLATTLTVACVLQHAWFMIFNPRWASVGSSFGAVTHQRRAFVDLYSVSPGPLQADRTSAGTGQVARLPSWVEDGDGDQQWARIDTAGSGWPMRAMASEAWVPKSGPVQFRHNWHVGTVPAGPVLIPLRPVLPGFAVDWLLFLVGWFLVLGVRVFRPAWWREGRHLRRGHCPRCGYDLQWDLIGGCSECGWRH